MKICLIWKNDYPWDVRIEKIALSLIQAGHEVHLLCSNTRQQQREADIHGILVRRLPSVNNRRLNALISTPFYFNPFWWHLISRTVAKQHIDLIIVRDIPLVLLALRIKATRHLPVILDMAENYPAMYWKRAREGGWSSVRSWFTKNPYLIELIERYASKHVDHIFVVVKESAHRLIAADVNPDKISIVGNTPDLTRLAKSSPAVTRGASPQALHLLYVGFIQEGRGLDTVLGALSRLTESGLRMKFSVIGDGIYLEPLRCRAREYHLESVVEFKGWMDNSLVPQYIHESDVGIIPHYKTAHTDTTIPNKLFDFMACGKPVIVSDADPMKRIVMEEQCGLVFRSGDPDDLRRAIEQALTDPDALLKMGTNGQRAVRQHYNWAHDSHLLTRVVAGFQT